MLFLLPGVPNSAFRSPGELPLTSWVSPPGLSFDLLCSSLGGCHNHCGSSHRSVWIPVQLGWSDTIHPGVLQFSSDTVFPMLSPHRSRAKSCQGCPRSDGPQSQGSEVPGPPDHLVTNSRDPRTSESSGLWGSFIIKGTWRARSGRRCQLPSPLQAHPSIHQPGSPTDPAGAEFLAGFLGKAWLIRH